jgi:hypothetical protein
MNILYERRLGWQEAHLGFVYENVLNISTWFYREQNNKNYK